MSERPGLWCELDQRPSGLNLLGLAVEESRSVATKAGPEDATLARQLYIHALTYLLRGLPSDLTAEEQLGVRASLPQGVVEPLRLEVNNGQLVGGQHGGADGCGTLSPSSTTAHTRSFLQRTLASLIVQMFLFVQFILPYVQTFLSNAYTYERTHHVSAKLLAASIDTVDSIGKRSLEVGGAVSKLGDGRVGQALNGVAAWCVEGVAGGICDGVGEGMMRLGAAATTGRTSQPGAASFSPPSPSSPATASPAKLAGRSW